MFRIIDDNRTHGIDPHIMLYLLCVRRDGMIKYKQFFFLFIIISFV